MSLSSISQSNSQVAVQAQSLSAPSISCGVISLSSSDGAITATSVSTTDVIACNTDLSGTGKFIAYPTRAVGSIGAGQVDYGAQDANTVGGANVIAQISLACDPTSIAIGAPGAPATNRLRVYINGTPYRLALFADA